MTDPQNPMHGYVHGHIHRHRDHTHIHGHIHSHEEKPQIPQEEYYSTAAAKPLEPLGPGSRPEPSTSTSQNPNSSQQSNLPSELITCPLEELPECEEVLCSELDDCYYSNCNDADIDECCTSNIDPACEDPGCLGHEELSKLAGGLQVSQAPLYEEPQHTICNNPNCLQNEDTTVCCYDDSHTKNHDNNLCLNVNDTKMFTQIFAEFQKDYNKSINELNTDYDILSESKTPSRLDNLSSAMTSFINSKDIHYPHEIHPINNIHKAFFHTNINEPNVYNGNELTDFDFRFRFNSQLNKEAHKLEELKQEKPNHPYNTFPCKWDNSCFSSVSNDNFVDHIVNDHFKDHRLYANNISSSEINCEWGDCKDSFDSLDAFIHHIGTHKANQNLNVLTPESTKSATLDSLSTALTPNVTPDLGYNIKEEPKEDDYKVNISNLQIKPKRVKDPIDANFTCQWDMGLGTDGAPIKCNQTHDSAGSLQDHVIEDHIGSGKSSYKCEWVGCERHNGKPFPQRQKLLRHIHIHTNHKPWKCEVCGSSFAVESMLTQHLRIHSGEKPFECNVCGKRFATSSSLSIHHRVHTGEKPLICKYPGCNKKFSESSNLTKHMKTHFKAFPCKVCGETFDKKSTYIRHMQLHHDHSIDQSEYELKQVDFELGLFG